MAAWRPATLTTAPPSPRLTISLRTLFPSASFVGCGDIRIAVATDRSTDCRPGYLFAAVSGTRWNGMQFVQDAVEAGATSLLLPRPIPDVAVPQCIVSDVRKAYARLCAALSGHPSTHLRIAGVTGTNGKTTVSWLIRAILRADGFPTGLLGTIEYDDGGHTQRAPLTTPEPHELSGWLAAMVRRGTTHAVVELSSHALHQGRCDGMALGVAVITNLTQDHFDYHGGFADYTAAKARILELCQSGGCVVWNADDDRVRAMVENCDQRIEAVSFGIETSADVSVVMREETLASTCFQIRFPDGKDLEIRTGLVGRHNVLNCLAAAVAARAMGASTSGIVKGIASLDGVPGRLEPIRCGQPFEVFVDYAHTDDALRRAITQLRRLTVGKVICVFGAGGDRDASKRTLLGRAGATADLAIVTSDNPRSEDPRRIVEDVAAGAVATGGAPRMVVDRKEAIVEAIASAAPGDSVLVAGKGHETVQVIGSRRLRFDDREIIREVLLESPQAWQMGVALS